MERPRDSKSETQTHLDDSYSAKSMLCACMQRYAHTTLVCDSRTTHWNATLCIKSTLVKKKCCKTSSKR